MSYTFHYNQSLNFFYAKFSGEITYSEEVETVNKAFQENSVGKNTRILVDRTESTFTSSIEDVRSYVALIGQLIKNYGTPKVAVVVSRDFDFGMIRMFEIRAEQDLIHFFKLCKDLSEACEWLGIDENDIPKSG